MSSNSDLPESEVNFDVNPDLGPNSCLCRPCETYYYQYKDCKSIRARVHQYFIFGHSLDCNHWKQDFDNCMKFRKTQNPNDLQKVVESELKQRTDRLKTAQNNDIWEYRTEPPKDWMRALPDWFLERNKNSFLSQKKENDK